MITTTVVPTDSALNSLIEFDGVDTITYTHDASSLSLSHNSYTLTITLEDDKGNQTSYTQTVDIQLVLPSFTTVPAT